MDLQEQLEVGKQAEDFLRYLSEHPYFEGLLERVKLELSKLILNLSISPETRDQYLVLRGRLFGVDDALEAVRGDVYLAAEAFKQLNGIVDEPKGIL
jgi:hypothetical protein